MPLYLACHLPAPVHVTRPEAAVLNAPNFGDAGCVQASGLLGKAAQQARSLRSLRLSDSLAPRTGGRRRAGCRGGQRQVAEPQVLVCCLQAPEHWRLHSRTRRACGHAPRLCFRICKTPLKHLRVAQEGARLGEE